MTRTNKAKPAEDSPEESVFRNHVSIDPEALDVEWLNQPSLFALYAEMEADAKAVIESLKFEIDVYRADLDLDIRKNFASYGLEKTTEASISNTITIDKGFIRLQEKLNRARHEASIFQAAVRAMDHRKASLENMVRLHASEYFAGPSTPRDLPEEAARIDQVSKRDVIRKVRKAMSRTASDAE